MAELIDRRLRISAMYLSILALFSFFGIIHSPSPLGNMFFPWNLAGMAQKIPYQFALAYLIWAAMFLLLSLTRNGRKARPEEPTWKALEGRSHNDLNQPK